MFFNKSCFFIVLWSQNDPEGSNCIFKSLTFSFSTSLQFWYAWFCFTLSFTFKKMLNGLQVYWKSKQCFICLLFRSRQQLHFLYNVFGKKHLQNLSNKYYNHFWETWFSQKSHIAHSNQSAQSLFWVYFRVLSTFILKHL